MPAGTMRPNNSPSNLIAVIFVHPHPHVIHLSTQSPTYGNSQWELIASGNHFGIKTLYAQEPNLVMTISGADSQGSPIVPSAWTGAPSQLWTATQVIGKLWTFVSLGGNALRALNFQVGAPLVLGAHDPSNNDADEYWVFPND